MICVSVCVCSRSGLDVRQLVVCGIKHPLEDSSYQSKIHTRPQQQNQSGIVIACGLLLFATTMPFLLLLAS